MARHWAPLRNPEVPESRSRNTIKSELGSASSQFGQRPLFSEPGPDQPPPEEGKMGPAAVKEDLHSVDRRESSDAVATLIKDEASSSVVFLTFSTDNVSLPPTDAQIEAAFGARTTGFVGFIIDNGLSGTVILCIKSQSDNWWFEIFTRAL